MPSKGSKNNGKLKSSDNGLLAGVVPDFFGQLATDDMGVDFGEVHPSALHSIIARICHLGGYIGFSAPAGGDAVKISVSVGGSSGGRWVRSGQELGTYISYIHGRLQEIERLLKQPPGDSVTTPEE